MIKKLLIASTLFLSSQMLTAQSSFCFKAKVDYPTGPTPTDIIAKDFDGDGLIDLASSMYGSSSSLKTFKGLASGTFSASITHSFTSSGSHGITAGAFAGGTGPILLAVTNMYANNVFILQHTGACHFVYGTSFTVGAQPSAIITDDFDADGKLDLVVTNSGTNTISFLKGLGTGNFVAAINYTVGSAPNSLTSGDFNADGFLDLAVANVSSNNISILRGSSTGTFATAVNYAVGSTPRSITTGDFNGDGKTDLAVANAGANNLSVLLGNGTGTFSAAVNYSTNGYTPYSVITEDFNSDGFLDLACVNYGSDDVSILPGTGTGIFSTAIKFPVGYSPRVIKSADFNGDGQKDILALNDGQTVSILMYGAPTLSVNSGTICAGNSFTIQPTGGNEYTYSGGSSIVSPSVTTTYTITGCSNTNTIDCTVNVSSLPTLSVNSGSICTGQTFTIMPNGANTYTYAVLVGPNTFTYTGNTQNFGPPLAGTYVVYINGTDVNGCSASLPVTSTVVISDCATDLEDVINFEASVSIFPNPNNGEFTIQSQKTEVISIVNDLGQTIEIIELNAHNNFSYKISSLQNGIYFLVGETVKQKIVVTK